MIGNALKHAEALAIGDEVDVGYAEKSAGMVERDGAGEHRLPALVDQLDDLGCVQRLLGSGDDRPLGFELAAPDRHPHRATVCAHLGRRERLELRCRSALLEACKDLHRLALDDLEMLDVARVALLEVAHGGARLVAFVPEHVLAFGGRLGAREGG